MNGPIVGRLGRFKQIKEAKEAFSSAMKNAMSSKGSGDLEGGFVFSLGALIAPSGSSPPITPFFSQGLVVMVLKKLIRQPWTHLCLDQRHGSS